MAQYRSKQVVDVTENGDGTVTVRYPGYGRTEVLTNKQLDERFQPLTRVLDWRRDGSGDDPGYGRLFDRNGIEINHPVFYADLDSGLILYRRTEWVAPRDGSAPYRVSDPNSWVREVCPAPLTFRPGRSTEDMFGRGVGTGT